MKILITAIQLTGIGGIESSLTNLISNVKDMYDIDLCVIGNYISPKTKISDNVKVIKGSKIFEYVCMDYEKRKKDYNIFEKIQIVLCKLYRHKVGMKKVLDSALGKFKIDGEYDVAISFVNDTYRFNSYMGGSEYVVLNCVNAKQKIAWIHNDAVRLGFTHENCFDNYNRFDKIVNVSYACKDIFDAILPEFKKKSYVVYNMFDPQKIMNLAEQENPYADTKKLKFVTVSRLDNEQKRIDRVLECCRLLKIRGITGFEWHIVGSGPDECSLHKMAFDYDVEDIVVFEGYQSNPYKYIKNADVLIMTSDYEAYSMVLTESLTLCTPIICTNYDSAGEIVKDGVNGWLVGFNVKEMCDQIVRIINDPSILNQVRDNIRTSPNANEIVFRQLDELLK